MAGRRPGRADGLSRQARQPAWRPPASISCAGWAGTPSSSRATWPLRCATPGSTSPKGRPRRRISQKVQDQINAWAEETGLPRIHISRILAMSIGENHPPEELQRIYGRASGTSERWPPSPLQRDNRRATSLAMTKKPAPDVLRIAVAQLNPTVGDVAGNLAKAREARADAARQGADLILFTELFIAGYPPEDLVLKPAFLEGLRDGGERFRQGYGRRWPGRHHRHATEAQERHAQLGRSWPTAARSSPSASRSICRTMASSTRSACSRPARTFQGRSISAACGSASRSARTSGANSASARRWPRAAPRCCWSERLALLSRQDGCSPSGGHPPGHRDRPAAALRQPARRPGRADLRRRVLRHPSRQVACLPDEPVRGDSSSVTDLEAKRTTAGSASTGRCRRSPKRRRPIIAPACSACATM